jgi:hypothetical protein
MADKIKLVQGDSRPQIKATLTDETTGAVIDISGSTVRLRMRAVGSTTILATVLGTLVAGLENDDGSITTAAPYNVPGFGGRVVFIWGANDLNVDAGEYEGEIEVTFADGSIQTVYDLLKFKVREDFA